MIRLIEIGSYVETKTKHRGRVRFMGDDSFIVILQKDNSCYVCPRSLIKGEEEKLYNTKNKNTHQPKYIEDVKTHQLSLFEMEE